MVSRKPTANAAQRSADPCVPTAPAVSANHRLTSSTAGRPKSHCAFKGRRFVLTSPNATALTNLVGKDEKIYEILDDADDIDAIVQASHKAFVT